MGQVVNSSWAILNKASSPPTHKLLEGVTFFPGCSALCTLLLHNIILWVESESLTCRLQKLGVGRTWQMEFPVLCHGRVTPAVDTATARVLPWGLTLGFPFILSSLKCSPSKWLQDWIWWFSYLQNAATRTNEQNSLSCQWAPVSLKPIFFNMRDYSCSYFLAFLLL